MIMWICSSTKSCERTTVSDHVRVAVQYQSMSEFFKLAPHEPCHVRMFLDCFWGLSPVGSRNDCFGDIRPVSNRFPSSAFLLPLVLELPRWAV